MANRKDTPGSLGRVIPVMLILVMLGIFLSLYFFKYVPQQQTEFNRRAFMELGQIERAVQGRNQGYTWAIHTFLENIHDGNPATNPILPSSFTIDTALPRMAAGNKENYTIGQTTITRNRENGGWQITYPLIFQRPAVHSGPHTTGRSSSGQPTETGFVTETVRMSTSMDTVLEPVIATYRDIFENYLLIRDSHLDSGYHSQDKFHQGQIMFNSGNLALDYLVNTDSLLKKNDGFSLLNIHDVSIEGSPYKLFLYPFQLGRDRIILAGLISLNKYTAGYKSISFGLLATIGILVLLLFIHLPILKIYILGPYERITGMNIRMIIGTYFVTAFIAFFLFSRIFLVRIQEDDNQAGLESLAGQVQKSFNLEISKMCRQLDRSDSIYANQIRYVPNLMKGMRKALSTTAPGEASEDSMRLDRLLYPDIYTFPDYIFWTDSAGKWIASWGARNIYSKPFDLVVTDRQYFLEFKKGNFLHLPDSLGGYSFTMQPALSKLDGQYTVVVAKKAESSGRSLTGSATPLMIAMSAHMYTNTNAVLPSGYNFSIIDDQGNILYDARPGRALLSNILAETDDPSAIRGSANFRNQRYFPSIALKGQQMAVLTTPMKGFPYTLLTYHNLSAATEFQTHLLLIAAFFAACMLALLIFSTLINEWSQKTPKLIHAPSGNFEWLHPVPEKKRYYRYLIRGMASLFGVYVLTWFLAEALPQQSEFSLFYISLLLPFYTALYYFRLREHERTRAVQSFLVLMIALIQVFALTGYGPVAGLLPVLLIAQAGFIVLLIIFERTYKKSSPDRSGEEAPDKPWLSLSSSPAGWLRNYAQAIVAGLFMIVIVPACGIFWIFFRQETNLRISSRMLNTSLAIGQRRQPLNEKAAAYKFFAGGPAEAQTALRQSLHEWKFRDGLYFPGDEILDTNNLAGRIDAGEDYSISLPYEMMHRWLFPGDTTELVWTKKPWQAGDSSWFFSEERHDKEPGRQLKYSGQPDNADTLSVNLLTGKEAARSAFSLMLNKTFSTGWLYSILYFGSQLLILFLIYVLTLSLARRIFLLGLIGGERCHPDRRGKIPETIVSHTPEGEPLSIDDIGRQERALIPYLRSSEQAIICRCWELDPFFTSVWASLSPLEKFILYDFALDGFTNYKTGNTLYKLYDKYLIHCEDTKLVFMTLSFREWVLQQSEDKDISALLKKARLTGPWQAFKLPLMILLATFGLFIFFTQDELYQKIAGLVASLSSMAHLFLPLFGKTNGKDDSGDS